MVVPASELCSARISPPCSAAISHTSDSPSPTPPYSRLRDLSTRKNGWKMLLRYAAAGVGYADDKPIRLR